MAALMRRSAAHAFAFVTTIAIVLLAGARAKAQDPPPPIPRIVVDLRGSFPKFPRTSELAASRGLDLAELPGVGLGIDAGIHLKVLKWKAVTFGLGGLLTLGRSHSSEFNEENQPIRRAVTERFTSLTPQLSLNFGNGNGWSYQRRDRAVRGRSCLKAGCRSWVMKTAEDDQLWERRAMVHQAARRLYLRCGSVAIGNAS